MLIEKTIKSLNRNLKPIYKHNTGTFLKPTYLFTNIIQGQKTGQLATVLNLILVSDFS